MKSNRRNFLRIAAAGAAAMTLPQFTSASAAAKQLKLGLVTYNWGKEWDVPTVIRNCSQTGFSGVELRSTHKHGVEIGIDARRRAKVRRMFEDSDVELVGLGSACEYHSVDPAVVKKNIEETNSLFVCAKMSAEVVSRSGRTDCRRIVPSQNHSNRSVGH